MDKKKVLIIDDEVDFCLLMQFYLSKKNCDVSISHTLRDGLGWPAAKNILEIVPDVELFLISANKPGTKVDCGDEDGDGGNGHCHIVEKPISISQIDKFLM